MSSCDWGFTFEAMRVYHDTEWGVPVHDDRRMFEHLMMEAMQCGLSWSLMIKKREISSTRNRGDGRIESIYQPYIDGLKEIREINAEYTAPFVRG